MSREIKFRAWNKKTSTMIDLYKITPLALSIEQDGLFLPFSEDYESMQFTGLFDKAGKEIYEGDVVSANLSSKGNQHGEVQFEDGGFGFYYNDRFGEGTACDLINVTGDECEVIGNIYENPEFLTPTSNDK